MRNWENKIDQPSMTDELRTHGFGEAANEIESLSKALEASQIEAANLNRCLREKDAAMSVLFQRLVDNNIDVSDLIP